MQQIVTKFGGTSVSTRSNWDCIVKITKNHIASGVQPIIVCSALTQISNQLEQAIDAALLNQQELLLNTIIQRHQQLAVDLSISAAIIEPAIAQLQALLTGIALLKIAPPKVRADVMSLGEVMMSLLGVNFLQTQGIVTEWLDVREALVSQSIPHTDDNVNYLMARCEGKFNPAFKQRLLNIGAQAIITQGFFAKNLQGETVLLGR